MEMTRHQPTTTDLTNGNEDYSRQYESRGSGIQTSQTTAEPRVVSHNHATQDPPPVTHCSPLATEVQEKIKNCQAWLPSSITDLDSLDRPTQTNSSPVRRPQVGHHGEVVPDTVQASRENQTATIEANTDNVVELQSNLPKLPVPHLSSTLDKYLTLLQPIVAPSSYSHTLEVVAEFNQPQGLGPELQEHLLKRQQAMDNWALDWWLSDMYLATRYPVIINSNPVAVFPYRRFASPDHQVRYAARFILGILDFKLLLDRKTLPTERCKYQEKGQPLCMEQHHRIFSSYRRPGRTIDVQLTDLSCLGPEYVIVASRGQFFKVEVSADMCPARLCQQLARVLTLAQERHLAPQLGILTSQERHVWAEHREILAKDSTNRDNLQLIENCLFIVCLDQPTVPSEGNSRSDLDNDRTASTHHIIHGQGVNTANRWMDKTIQLIVSEDGTCGINMEHSVAEGIAVGHCIEHAFNHMKDKGVFCTCTKNPDVEPDRTSSNCKGSLQDETCRDASVLPPPAWLNWSVSSDISAAVRTAKEKVDQLISDFDLQVFRFDHYGRDFIKSQRKSPDAFIQLALQLTYFKIHGKFTATYESASVRRFRKGRVDVIRAHSPHALIWVKAMLGLSDCTDSEKLRLFAKAHEWQQQYTAEAIQGQGVDLHLLGLREAAAELGQSGAAFFCDPSFQEFHHFRLSTSQVPTVSDYWMGYGAVVPDGYGCCYNPQPDFITFSVASFYDCEDTSSHLFVHSLESSLLQMAELCQLDRGQVGPAPSS